MHESTSYDSIQQQLDQLRAENQRMKKQVRLSLFAAPALLVAVAALGGWSMQQDELTAKSIKLVDAAGKVGAHIDSQSIGFVSNNSPKMVINTEGGEPNIVMFDKNAKGRLVLGVSAEGAVVTMMDEKGSSRMVMTQQGKETAINVAAEDGKEGVMIASGGEGSLIQIQDAKEKTRVSMAAVHNQPSGMFIHDENGGLRLGFVADSKEGVISFHDGKGQPVKTITGDK